MDDFFKTKVGFTIGLLAAVFAFKPLVDSNADVGFTIFQVKITIEYAYIFLTAFLGLAVYFISLQFASTKHVRILDATSDACYSIALATPPVFLAFWFITISFSYVGAHVSQTPAFVINVLASLISAIFANVTYSFLQKSIKSKFLAAEKQHEQKVDIEILARAKELTDLGMYDMSVLESSKVVESALRRLLEKKGISVKKGTMIELVRLSEENKILSAGEINFLNEIMKKRNESAHLIDAVDKRSAERVLHISRELIAKLDAISSSSGYEWLEKNRRKVIQLLREGDLRKCRQSLDMLKEAWRQRDGAVWLELSEFFEVALISNPELIVYMFEDDEELLDSWLKRVDVQLFTDFVGGEKERLTEVRTKIISQLSKYISDTNSKPGIDVASKILAVIIESEITRID